MNIISEWIPQSTPPSIEGIYEVKDAEVTGGYQKYKNGCWGVYGSTIDCVQANPIDYCTKLGIPTHWRELR